MYSAALMKMTRRCIDRVYCLSDRAAIYAPAFLQEAKNINLHASQLSGGSKQTGAGYHRRCCCRFSVFSTNIRIIFPPKGGTHEIEMLLQWVSTKKQYYLSKESLSLIKAHL